MIAEGEKNDIDPDQPPPVRENRSNAEIDDLIDFGDGKEPTEETKQETEHQTREEAAKAREAMEEMLLTSGLPTEKEPSYEESKGIAGNRRLTENIEFHQNLIKYLLQAMSNLVLKFSQVEVIKD